MSMFPACLICGMPTTLGICTNPICQANEKVTKLVDTNESDEDTRPQPQGELVEELTRIIDAVDERRDFMLSRGAVERLRKGLKSLTALQPSGDVSISRECDYTIMLIEDNKAMREAGDELAAAALRVTHEYDGVHRLNLAVSKWSQAIADEGGRGKSREQALSQGDSE